MRRIKFGGGAFVGTFVGCACTGIASLGAACIMVIAAAFVGGGSRTLAAPVAIGGAFVGGGCTTLAAPVAIGGVFGAGFGGGDTGGCAACAVGCSHVLVLVARLK